MSSHDDDVRQLAAALRAGGEDARPRDDCPPAETIWAAARGELPLDERLAVIDHTVECPVCAEAWRLATELDPDAAGSRTAPSGWGAWVRSQPAWRWAAAAVLAVGVGAVLTLRVQRPGEDPALRDPRVGAIESLVESGASLPRDDFTLRWSSGPPGTRYDLTVTTSDLQPVLVVRGLERPEHRVPPERLAGVPSGARLLWRVVARRPDGGTTASPTFEVGLR